MTATQADRGALLVRRVGARASDPGAVGAPGPVDRVRRGPLSRPAGQVLLAVLAGLVVGAVTSFGQTVLGDTAFAGLANAVSPWLVLPFVVGALALRDRQAAVLGLLACVGQVAGYYLVAHLRGFGVGSAFVTTWAVAGVVGGPLFGWAGRAWRTATGRLRGAGGALMVAAWGTEAVVTYAIALHDGDQAVVFGVVAVVAAVVLGVVGRQVRALLVWLPVACLLGAAGFGVMHAVL